MGKNVIPTIIPKKTNIPTPIAFAPDEVWNIYVDISNDLHLDIQNFKLLIQKANSYV